MVEVKDRPVTVFFLKRSLVSPFTERDPPIRASRAEDPTRIRPPAGSASLASKGGPSGLEMTGWQEGFGTSWAGQIWAEDRA
jgi:hypothetical protein